MTLPWQVRAPMAHGSRRRLPADHTFLAYYHHQGGVEVPYLYKKSSTSISHDEDSIEYDRLHAVPWPRSVSLQVASITHAAAAAAEGIRQCTRCPPGRYRYTTSQRCPSSSQWNRVGCKETNLFAALGKSSASAGLRHQFGVEGKSQLLKISTTRVILGRSDG
jgi:hypothetical protein